MKFSILAVLTVTAFSAVSFADPIIECPPDYQGGRMITPRVTIFEENGNFRAISEMNDTLRINPLTADESQDFVLKLTQDRDCRFY